MAPNQEITLLKADVDWFVWKSIVAMVMKADHVWHVLDPNHTDAKKKPDDEAILLAGKRIMTNIDPSILGEAVADNCDIDDIVKLWKWLTAKYEKSTKTKKKQQNQQTTN